MLMMLDVIYHISVLQCSVYSCSVRIYQLFCTYLLVPLNMKHFTKSFSNLNCIIRHYFSYTKISQKCCQQSDTSFHFNFHCGFRWFLKSGPIFKHLDFRVLSPWGLSEKKNFDKSRQKSHENHCKLDEYW